MADRKTLSLWNAACWTYRKQRAHAYLRTGRLCFEWAISAGNLTDDGPRPKVHWDAAMIHGAVCEIGERYGQHLAEAVIIPAVTGEKPELPDSQPAPMPYEIDGYRQPRNGERHPEAYSPPVEMPPSQHRPAMSRPARGYCRGRRVEILVKTIGFEHSSRPVYERRGRRMVKEVGTEPIWLPIEYCPLRWEPDPGWFAAAVGAYRAWREGMILLAEAVKRLELREHIVVPEAIPPVPEGMMTTMEFDSWADCRNEYEEVQAQVVEMAGGETRAWVVR